MSFTPNIPGHRVYGNIDLSGGTISAGSLSATTIYSGGTPLTEIFATTGTTFIQPSQIVFGSSTSGITSSNRLIWSDAGKFFNIDSALVVGNITGTKFGFQSLAGTLAFYSTLSEFTGAINAPSLTATTISADTIYTNAVQVNQVVFAHPSTSILTGHSNFSYDVASSYLSLQTVGIGNSGGNSIFRGLSNSTVLMGTTAYKNYFSIADSQNILGFQTNSVQRAYFDANEFVISTPTRATSLSATTLSGQSLTLGDVTSPGIYDQSRVQLNNGSSITIIYARTNDSNFGNPLGNGALDIATTSSAGAVFGTTSNTPIVFGTNNLPRFWIQNDGLARTTNFSATTISGTTYYSGNTTLTNAILNLAGSGGEVNTASNVNGGPINTSNLATFFKQKSVVDLEFRTLSAGTNITLITGDTITIQATGGGSQTYVQPGLNIYTGGTSAAPTINISAATLSYLSAQTITANTIVLNTTSNAEIEFKGGGVANIYNSTSSQDITITANNGDIFFSTDNYGSYLFNLVGTNAFVNGDLRANTFTASTVSASTVYAGPWSLYNITSNAYLTALGYIGNITASDLQLNATSTNLNLQANQDIYIGADTTGKVSVGSYNVPTARLDIQSGSTSFAQLRLRSGATVSSPNNGDVWNDGTHLYTRLLGRNVELDNYLPATQIAFGSSTSGITGTSRFIHAPTTTASKFEFRDWVGVADYPTIYLLPSGTTASNSNYTLTSDGPNTYLNAPTGHIHLTNVGVSVLQIVSTGSVFSSPLNVSNSFRANSISATTVSGETLYSGATNLSTTIISIANAAASATGDFTRVQGSNFITTGGTANAPIINLAQNFSGATVSGGTLYSGATNLSTTIISIANAAASAVDTAVQAGSNIATGGTAAAPTISVVASPSLNALILSGAGQFAGVTSTGLSATTVSGGTIYSGFTNLSTTIISVANAAASATGDFTRVQGSNFITTGGTANAPTINLSQNFSGATVSGGTIYSGATNLSTTIISIANAAASAVDTAVQAGSNIATGGTAAAPTISVVASPSLNALILSGAGQFAGVTSTGLSATTVSGGTIYSGFTNLSTTIISVANAAASAVDTAVQAGSNIATGGTAAAPTVSVVASPSLNALTLSGAGQFAGVTSTGLSATTVSATTIFSATTSMATIIDRFSTRVQAGSNISTGGTPNAPSVSIIASPSLNALTLSGAGQFAGVTSTGLSATTVSATTIFSATTSMATIIDRFSTRVQAGSNIATGGTPNAPIVSLIASPSVTGIVASGTSTFQATTASSFSASTITGQTYWSGTSSLAQAIQNLASGSGEANTASNIGGAGTTLTNSAPLFKQKTLVDLEFRMLSAGTNVTFISGDTITIRAAAGSVSISQATINFGPITSRQFQTATTVFDAGILTSSKILAVLVSDATSEHTAQEILFEDVRIATGNIVNGVSFEIFAYSPKGTYGSYKVNYTIQY